MYQLSSGFQSPSGHSSVGVAIIRLSGPQALGAALLLSRRASLPRPRRAERCSLWDAHSGELLDSPCLLLHFPAPHSFTGEDVVELHVHGNPLISKRILAALHALTFPLPPPSASLPHPTALPGLREAAAGEFTRRAFLHGKLDLTQVEALADLLSARTESQQSLALSQLSGSLSSLYAEWRATLVGVLAHVEAVLDFSEDEPDVSAASILRDVLPRTRALVRDMREHMRDEGRGELIREGVELCILGRVNVGKSSLMNALVGRDVSIVSDEAGTTRDVLEAALNIGGYAVRIVDTAGLRDSGDRVEREGVRRARSRAERAQLKLVVLDATAQHEDEEEIGEMARLVDGSTIVVFSKVDLVHASPASTSADGDAAHHRQLHSRSRSRSASADVDMEAARTHVMARFSGLIASFPTPPLAVVPLSSVTRQGLAALTSALAEVLRVRLSEPSRPLSTAAPLPLITRERHRLHVGECVELLERCLRLIGEDELVLAAEQLRFAVTCMGRIVGRVDVEEVLDVIFADFCIGK